MKYLVYFIFLFPVQSFAQVGPDSPEGYIGSLPTKSGRIFFSGVDTVSADKIQLFLRAKDYLSSAFRSYKEVSIVEDKDMGKLSVRGLFNTTIKDGAILKTYIEYLATTTVYVKDGKYRYEISDFVEPSEYNFTLEQKMFNKKRAHNISSVVEPYIRNYIGELDKAMRNPNNDNW